MKKFFYATMCVMSLFLSGCGYDDDEVWNAINDQEERIAALEEWQKTANENIAALQAIVNGNDYITSVEEIKEGDEVIGYTINFYRQGEVTIYNGKDGEKGDMPVISVTEGEDGRWYWTVNGELMEDADAASAGIAVGYESPTQFNREYKRMFGAPPRRDIMRRR